MPQKRHERRRMASRPLTRCSICGELNRLPSSVAHCSSTKRGYNYHWRVNSRSYLSSHPICEICNNAASELVHHVDNLRQTGEDTGRYQAVCRDCHVEETYGS